MDQPQTDTLKVPDATLHYEVRGSGPVLLCIPGGPADGGGFAPIRDLLADRYTVVTYDPRGLSHSPFDGEPQDTTVQTFADDAHRLLGRRHRRRGCGGHGCSRRSSVGSPYYA